MFSRLLVRVSMAERLQIRDDKESGKDERLPSEAEVGSMGLYVAAMESRAPRWCCNYFNGTAEAASEDALE